MINLDWVKDYIDISEEDLKSLAVKITEAGINIEKVITNHIDNLVIGKILKCSSHPNSDHLNICMVDVGSEVVQIVCGASNVRDNLKVIVALPGAVLPGDFVIKKSTIRGEESNGMICALFELGLEEKTEENYNRGIEELDDDAPVGKDPLVYLNLTQTLYELDIHKHRNNDCYYHIGFAYEIAAIINKEVKLPDVSYNSSGEDINNSFKVDVKTDKCNYYLAKMVKDVKIKESPEFIKNRLISLGMRPINNVVDISNYVMLEFGQPLHFFDKDALGDYILVRDAKENEKIITLDNKERTLNQSDIVITNGKEPVCIAGVMGGLNTEVTENTKNILIESAIFDSVSIRNTASKLNLKSEASIRYGKGLNYEYTLMALDRACHLLEKYADAKIETGTVVYDKVDKTENIVEFYPEEINKMLGITIDSKDMEFELHRLGFPYSIKDKKFTVTIPKRRIDIDPNVNDIAEEIGRLYGYQNLVSTLPKVETKKGEYAKDIKYRKVISKRLRALGFNEVKTYTLTSPSLSKMFDYEKKEKIILPNPLSEDKSVIRTTLIPSLLSVYSYNKARKVNDIMIYEISKTYDKTLEEEQKIAFLMKGIYNANSLKPKQNCDFYLMKGMVENILNLLGFDKRYDFKKEVITDLHPGISASILIDNKKVGIIGRVHPSINKDEIYVCELSLNSLMKRVKPLKYQKSSIYPDIVKDVAFLIDEDIESSNITKEIRKNGGGILTNINIFDLYVGEHIEKNKKSIAYSLTFNSSDRTLTEEEVDEVFRKIIDKVRNKFNCDIRDK